MPKVAIMEMEMGVAIKWGSDQAKWLICCYKGRKKWPGYYLKKTFSGSKRAVLVEELII